MLDLIHLHSFMLVSSRYSAQSLAKVSRHCVNKHSTMFSSSLCDTTLFMFSFFASEIEAPNKRWILKAILLLQHEANVFIISPQKHSSSGDSTSPIYLRIANLLWHIPILHLVQSVARSDNQSFSQSVSKATSALVVSVVPRLSVFFSQSTQSESHQLTGLPLHISLADPPSGRSHTWMNYTHTHTFMSSVYIRDCNTVNRKSG